MNQMMDHGAMDHSKMGDGMDHGAATRPAPSPVAYA